MVGLAAAREAAGQMIVGGMSERKACGWLKVRRKSYRYRRKKADNANLGKRIKELALKHPRFGYRRIWALLVRAGELINVKKVYRLWRELKLALPKRRPRKARAKPFIGIMPKALAANQIWTYDFVFDEAVSGRKLKMLTLIDEYTRECLAVEVDTSITSLKVRQILERVCMKRGFPKAIRSDNGSEFIGQARRRMAHVKSDRAAVHRSRQAVAERQVRELQRQTAGRMPEPRMVPLAPRSPRRHRNLATVL